MILIGAIIIFCGLIAHAVINHYTIMLQQERHSSHQLEIQMKQQRHEMEFAAQQAEMFRKSQDTKKRVKAEPPCNS